MTLVNCIKDIFCRRDAHSPHLTRRVAKTGKHSDVKMHQALNFNLSEPVFKLPPEIWQLIASLLPPYARALLAFSSPSMLFILGEQYFKDLVEPGSRDQISKYVFLTYLNRTLPRHRLCWECKIYHYGHQQCPKDNSFVPICGSYKISFTDAQLATRVRLYGPEFGKPLEDRLSIKGDCGWKHSIRYAFIAGHNRKQHLALRVDSTKKLFPGTNFPEFMRLPPESRLTESKRTLPSCYHYRNELISLCKCALEHQEPDQQVAWFCTRCRDLRRCHSCATEYLIQIESQRGKPDWKPGHGILKITRWSDLGHAQNPLTSEWDSAASWLWQRRDQVYDIGDLPSIQHRFEASQSHEVDDRLVFPLPRQRNAYFSKLYVCYT